MSYSLIGILLFIFAGLWFTYKTYKDSDHITASNDYWNSVAANHTVEEAVIEAPKKARKPRAKKVAE